MSRPAPRRRAAAPARPPASNQINGNRINSFLHHLGQSGSISLAATRAGLDRRALYHRRDRDEAFAARWDEALNLGIDRLQDDAMRRALEGTSRGVWRNGRQVGSVRQFDNRLLQFLLKAHRPQVYGDRSGASARTLPFDLAQRLAAAALRIDAYDAAEQAKAHSPEKTDGKSTKQGG